MIELSARHWLIALACAIGVHLSLVTLFARPGETSPLGQGILIELGDGSRAGADIAGPEGPAAAESPSQEPPLPEATEPAPAPENIAEEPEAPLPEPTPDPSLLTDAVPTPVEEPAIEEFPIPVKPVKTVRTNLSPKKPKKASSAKNRKKAPKTRRQGKAAKSAAGVTGGGTGGKAGRSSGAGSAASAAAKSRYAGQVTAWLNRNKRYPQRARRLGHQGLVTVRFTLGREGRVLDFNIVRSSGHAALDDEVRDLMRRGHMPPMPAAMQQSRMTMLAPIRFKLR